MIIKLTSDDVITAVKEYMLRRGVPSDLDMDVFVRGGRKGNSGTAEVEIKPKSGADISAPKTYENMFGASTVTEEPELVDKADAVVESFAAEVEELAEAIVEAKAEAVNDLKAVAEEYTNDPDTMAKDLRVFTETKLTVAEAKEKSKQNSVGSLFGDAPVTKAEKVVSNPPTNPFK